MHATITDQSKRKKRVTAPFVVAAIAAILTPGAYLLGLSYYQGYMSAFGVETDGFPISAPDVYVFSYQTVGYFLLSIGGAAANLLGEIFRPPMVYWLIFTLCLCIGGVYWFLKARKMAPHPLLCKLFEKVKWIVSKLHWKNNDLTRSVGFVVIPSYGLLSILSVSITVALFWWLLPLSAYSKGKAVATERIKLFHDKGCYADEKSKWNNCFLVLDEKGNELHEGLLIAMNDKVIAIFKKDGSYIFTRKDDFMLRRKLH
ncbi:MAG TPA: hypothetical protein VMV75_12235 [Sulfuricella sp.]|nr:hypothetical protein [Sulfuricella sp.]